jgi:hypothetical protein
LKIVGGKLLLFVTLHTLSFALSAKTYEISDFSSVYYALVDDIKSELIIKKKKNNKLMFKVNLDSVNIDNEVSNSFLPNAKERSYDNQSLIIYKDFNFDGKNDFAIKDGYNSCYGGPSFLIYLKKGTGFYLDGDFTRISQDYCGMFSVDERRKTIHAMTKSGCCWHLYDDYKVFDGKLKLIKSVEEKYASPFIERTIKEHNGKKTSVRKTYDIDINHADAKLSFKLENGKRALLFEDHNFLYYALMNKKGELEFAFNINPLSYNGLAEPGKSFIYISDYSDNREIHFNTEDAKYTIYQDGQKEKISQIGIRVETKGKLYDLKGLAGTLKGDLSVLFDSETNWANRNKFKNVLTYRINPHIKNKFILGIYEDIKEMTPSGYVRIMQAFDVENQPEPDVIDDDEKINLFIHQYTDAIKTKDRDRFFSLYNRDQLLYLLIYHFSEIKSAFFFDNIFLGGYTYSIPKDKCKNIRHLSCQKKEQRYHGCWVKVTMDDIVDIQVKDTINKNNKHSLYSVFTMKDGSEVYSENEIEKMQKEDGEVLYVFTLTPG